MSQDNSKPVPYEYLVGIQEGRSQYNDFEKYATITQGLIQDRITTETDLVRMFQGSPMQEVFKGCRDFWKLKLMQLETREKLLTGKRLHL